MTSHCFYFLLCAAALLLLDCGTTIQGQVSLADGQPAVEGTRVYTQPASKEVSPDPEGFFKIHGLKKNRVYSFIAVGADGSMGIFKKFHADKNEGKRIQIILEEIPLTPAARGEEANPSSEFEGRPWIDFP